MDFVCDYYSYNGDFQNTYLMGEQLTVSRQMKISDVPVGNLLYEISGNVL